MDCVIAKKRTKECDAECPAEQSGSTTVSGHEVRVVGSPVVVVVDYVVVVVVVLGVGIESIKLGNDIRQSS